MSNGVSAPPSLGEREVTDMIADLRASENKKGVCEEHPLLVRSAILGHRQSEQIQYGVATIQNQLQVLMAKTAKNQTGVEEDRENTRNFRFHFLKIFDGSWKGYSSYDICKITFALFICGILSYLVYAHVEVKKQLATVRMQSITLIK